MPNAQHPTSESHHVHHAELGSVAILGLGLIGGSLGQVLCAIGAADPVVGWDPDPSVCPLALDHAAIHHAAKSAQSAVESADLIVLAGPVETIIPTLEAIKSHRRPDAVVTDVGSAK